MLRAKLRGRTRRPWRASFRSSLGGCACSRFFGPTAGSGKYCALLDRVAATWPGSNVCEGKPAPADHGETKLLVTATGVASVSAHNLPTYTERRNRGHPLLHQAVCYGAQILG